MAVLSKSLVLICFSVLVPLLLIGSNACFAAISFSAICWADSFVSLLQQKYSPIPYQLRSQLLSIILQKPGFGNQDWNDCIENFIADKDHEKSEKVRRKIVELFLTFDGFEEQKAVHKSKEIVDYLIDWSGSLVHQINQVEIKT